MFSCLYDVRFLIIFVTYTPYVISLKEKMTKCLLCDFCKKKKKEKKVNCIIMLHHVRDQLTGLKLPVVCLKCIGRSPGGISI